jgi:hypothetical protein
LLSLGLSLSFETAQAQGATQTAQKKTTPKTKPAAAAVETKPVLEPKAIELLKASCARLAAAHSMSFTAEVIQPDAGEATYFDVTRNSTPDSTPVGSINRARGLGELASRKARLRADSS